MPRYDVFLSHASADKPAVEHLARKLGDEGIEPFLDKWHLIPGEPWQEALEEALDQSRTCAVFLGKTMGPWQNEEMRSALETRVRETGFRVIPVLLPGGKEPGKEDLPRFLFRLTWVDFRAGLDDEDAYRRLLAGIKGKPPGPGSGEGRGPHSLLDSYRCMAPAREPFVQRSEYAKVRDTLVLDGESTGLATTAGITTAIHGAGGFGKTALAIELCYDEQVREHYPAGILWTTMGEEIDDAGRLARVRDLIRWWTEKDPPAFETVSAASAHLRKELAGKRVLLMVDDVWCPEDIAPFQGWAALLLTTRDSRTLPAGSVPVYVDAMEIPEAVRLLGAGLPDGTGVDLRGLAGRLGEWPLLLKIVNRQLQELTQEDGLSLELALREVEEALDTEGLTVFDREDFEARDQAVAGTVGASLRRLSGEEVSRFERLAIFPEDKDIPLPVLEKLWELESFAAKKLCARLHYLSLLLRFDRVAGSIRLHDVIRAYLLKNGERQLTGWNRQFLEAYRPASSRWPDLPPEESYLWNHLVHHLVGAGQSDVARSLLLSFPYLHSKLKATEINALLTDYSIFAEKDEELRLVREALRLSLARDRAELPGQLLGRLLDRRETGIQNLLASCEGMGSPWLRPRRASLNRPGGALLQILQEPGERILAAAVLDEFRVISGNARGEISLWDLESGRSQEMSHVSSEMIMGLAVLDRTRFVSGGADSILRIWDLETREPRQTLQENAPILGIAAHGSHIASSSGDGQLRIWDADAGRLLSTFEGPVFSRGLLWLDETRILVGSADYEVLSVDWSSGKVLHRFSGHTDQIHSFASTGDGRIVSASGDRAVRVWDLETGRCLHTLYGHDKAVMAILMFDSRVAISGSLDHTLCVWDLEKGLCLRSFEAHAGPIYALSRLPDQRFVSSAGDGTLKVWDLNKLLQVSTAAASVKEVAITSSTLLGGCAVWGCSNGMVQAEDLKTGEIRFSSHVSSNPVIALAPLNNRRFFSLTALGEVSIEELGVSESIEVTFIGTRLVALALRRSLDLPPLVIGSTGRELLVFDPETGEHKSYRGKSLDLRCLVADREEVLCGFAEASLGIWNLKTGSVKTSPSPVHGIASALTLVGKETLVCGFSRGELVAVDRETFKLRESFQGHAGRIVALAALDHRRFLSGSEDRTISLWSLDSPQLLARFSLDSPISSLSVGWAGKPIIVGDSNGGRHVFDLVE